MHEETIIATLFSRMDVADFANWKRVYDGGEGMRKSAGVTRAAVYQTAGSPNEVTAAHDFATIEAAQAFAGSEELKSAMQSAGVQGAPTMWFATAL